jgi:hypothetical protein
MWFSPTFVAVKKFIAIGLIFVMSAQCFYQLGVITYFQLNKSYIAEVLCINKEKPITMCYGQCFLNKNLDLADDQPLDNGTVPISKQRIDFPVFLVIENSYSFRSEPTFEIAGSSYLVHISAKHCAAPFHPPAVLS